MSELLVTFSELKPLLEEQASAIILEEVKGLDYFENAKACQNLAQKINRAFLKHSRSFKYVVHCTMIPTGQTSLTSAASSYWDSESDGFLMVKKEVGKTKVIVNAFYMAV